MISNTKFYENMKNPIYYALFLFYLLCSCEEKQKSTDDLKPAIEKQKLFNVGEHLYKMHCLSCHGVINANDNILRSVMINSTYDNKFFFDFVNNQDSLLNAEDEKTIKIKAEYGNNPYVHNFNFSVNELKCIKLYLSE